MKPQRIESIVYIIGVFLLGIAYFTIKQAVPTPIFLVGVLAYLVVLRVLGKYLATRLAVKEAHGSSDV